MMTTPPDYATLAAEVARLRTFIGLMDQRERLDVCALRLPDGRTIADVVDQNSTMIARLSRIRAISDDPLVRDLAEQGLRWLRDLPSATP
jgi:hypothetical protein